MANTKWQMIFQKINIFYITFIQIFPLRRLCLDTHMLALLHSMLNSKKREGKVETPKSLSQFQYFFTHKTSTTSVGYRMITTISKHMSMFCEKPGIGTIVLLIY